MTPGRRRPSVRATLTAVAAAVVGLALTLGSVFLVLDLRHQLTEGQDAAARARVDDLLQLADTGQLPDVLADVGDDEVIQVVRGDTVLSASPGLAGNGPLDAGDVGDEPTRLTMIGVPDDDETEDYRVWTAASRGPDGQTRVFVGHSLESVHEAVATVRHGLLLGVPVVVALVALIAWLLVGRALAPVEAIRSEVVEISARDLDRRVPRTGRRDEIDRLAETMNAMLDRVEAATARQRDFVADASHELQSPIAAAKAQLEVSIAHPEGVDWSRLADDLLANTERMEHLVRDLLLLARLDADPGPARRARLDLGEVVADEVGLRAPAERPAVSLDVAGPAPVWGDAAELGRLVRNLLDNAVAWAADRVVVSVRAMGDLVEVVVADDGPGIPAAERERVFDRFTRLDQARSPSGRGGTGLGLAIAAAIAADHGGTLRVGEPDGPGARLVLTLPTAGADGR